MIKAIPFHDILVEIDRNFCRMDEWGEDLFRDWGRVDFYLQAALTLLEFAEFQTCGSIGGFGEGQQNYKPPINPHRYLQDKIWGRYAFLCENFEEKRC